MEKGKYERIKSICPDCGITAYLPLHKNYCRGENHENKSTKKEKKNEGEKESNIFTDIEIISGDDSDFPLLDTSFTDSVKRNAVKISNHIKGGKPISKKNFGELIKNLNKIFVFFEMPEYCLTDDDLELILDDLYYLIGKYFPDFLKYLSNDLIVLGRLTTNILYLVKTKYIERQIALGLKNPDELKNSISEIINSDGMENVRDMVKNLGVNLGEISNQIKSGEIDLKNPNTSQKQKVKLIDHSDIVKKLEETQNKLRKEIGD